MDGQGLVDPSLFRNIDLEEKAILSPREGDLLSLIVQGLKNKEIATELGISEGTVKVYLSHLYTKLRVRDRFELALSRPQESDYAWRLVPATGTSRRPDSRRPTEGRFDP